MLYTYQDFQADKPRLLAAIARVRPTGLTGMGCCIPAQWLQELAAAAGLPAVAFAKRSGSDLDVRVCTVTRSQLMSPRTLSIYASQEVQPVVVAFVYPTREEIRFEGQR